VLDALDIVMIHQLLGRYGHTIEQRDWIAFGDLFTDDASIDYVGSSSRTTRSGRQAIVDWFRDIDTGHPGAHHVTNIVADESCDRSGPVTVHSKFFAPFSRPHHVPKRLYGGDYRDIVVCTDHGWKFSHKHCIPTWNLAVVADDAAPASRLTF
jgi:SnoaL-like domain